MKLAILGGSFDPPHCGHSLIAAGVRSSFGLDQVLALPNYCNPFKNKTSASAFHRFAMLALAFQDCDFVRISDIEVSRNQACYTCETLEQIAETSPGAELYFIAGADNVADFQDWYRFERILELARIIIVDRNGISAGKKTDFLSLPLSVPFSSTEIRHRILNGESARGMVHESVLAYIERHGLYRKKQKEQEI